MYDFSRVIHKKKRKPILDVGTASVIKREITELLNNRSTDIGSHSISIDSDSHLSDKSIFYLKDVPEVTPLMYSEVKKYLGPEFYFSVRNMVRPKLNKGGMGKEMVCQITYQPSGKSEDLGGMLIFWVISLFLSHFIWYFINPKYGETLWIMNAIAISMICSVLTYALKRLVQESTLESYYDRYIGIMTNSTKYLIASVFLTLYWGMTYLFHTKDDSSFLDPIYRLLNH